MDWHRWIEKIGMLAAFIMPLWNIPLIMRIMQRKSSDDISLPWALGVWFCILLMFPSAFVTKDATLRIYSATNFIFFTGVVAVVLKYHKR